ncbi:hypothetical protein ACWA5Z_06465 [Testudinibacter sp. P80/BLE/0925]
MNKNTVTISKKEYDGLLKDKQRFDFIESSFIEISSSENRSVWIGTSSSAAESDDEIQLSCNFVFGTTCRKLIDNAMQEVMCE